MLCIKMKLCCIQRCFVSNEIWLHMKMLRCERKEGKVFLAFGSKGYQHLFHPQQSSSHMEKKGKMVLQDIHKCLQ
jgi:hypothetical protein